MATIQGILKPGRRTEMRSVAIYTFANFFNKGISFLLLFYFTRVLTQADFGMLNLFSNSIIFLMPFISMGVLHSVNAEYFKKEKKEFSNFFSTTFFIPVAMTLLAIIIMFLLKEKLKEQYAFPYILVILVPVITLLNFIYEQFINMARNNNEPTRYLLVNIGKLLIEITLAVIFISGLGYNWLGRVTAIMIAYGIAGVYAWRYFHLKQYSTGVFQKKYIAEELQYSVPVICTQASMFFMSSSAGYFIQYFSRDYSSVGIYSVAVTLASLVLVLSSALLQYFNPKIYMLLKQPKTDYSNLLKYFLSYAGAMLLATLFIIAAIPFVYHLGLRPSYNPGLSYYYFICAGYFLWSLSIFFYPFMFYHKSKKKLMLVSLSSIIVCIAAQYLFIKNFDTMGAAISICIVYFINLIITIITLHKELVPLLSVALLICKKGGKK